jgi:hypothetical protein
MKQESLPKECNEYCLYERDYNQGSLTYQCSNGKPVHCQYLSGYLQVINYYSGAETVLTFIILIKLYLLVIPVKAAHLDILMKNIVLKLLPHHMNYAQHKNYWGLKVLVCGYWEYEGRKMS